MARRDAPRPADHDQPARQPSAGSGAAGHRGRGAVPAAAREHCARDRLSGGAAGQGHGRSHHAGRDAAVRAACHPPGAGERSGGDDRQHRRGAGAAGGGRPAPKPAGGLTTASAFDLIRRAISLANAAADGAGDEEVTPSEIAEVIRDALESPELTRDRHVIRYLQEALDAVSDGMPPDYTTMILYSALGRLREV